MFKVKLLRATIACEVDGESEILLLYVVSLPDRHRVVLEWADTIEPPGNLAAVRYVDVPVDFLLAAVDPNDPMELSGAIPSEWPWVTVTEADNEVLCFPASEFPPHSESLL